MPFSEGRVPRGGKIAVGAVCVVVGVGILSACSSSSSRTAPPMGPPGQDSGTNEDSGPSGANDAGHVSPGNDAGVNEAGCFGTVPLVYEASTDRLPHAVTTPPTLGPAGTIVKDPTYGTSLVRVTDATTVAGSNLSYRVANEFWGNDWNTDATLFYLQDSSGGLLLYNFNPSTLAAMRVPSMATPGSPLAMPLGSGGFSRTQPTILYGMKGMTLGEFDFSTQTETDLVDLTTIVPGVTGNALGVQEGANGLLAAVFGGPEQDEMPDIATYDPATSTHHVLDVAKSTLDGTALTTPIGGGVHIFHFDHSGVYLTFAVAGGSSTDWVWDTTTNTISTLPSSGAFGWGAWVRGGGATDSYQWQLTTFASPTVSTPLIAPLLTPTDTLASSSVSWENAVSGASVPVIVETMRQPADTGPWRAWDDEVVAVDTGGALTAGEGGVQESVVWRFAHTFNTYTGTIYSDAFYYLFIPRVSQNGAFVLFDSNWNQTLGTDATGDPRTDAFVVALPDPCVP